MTKIQIEKLIEINNQEIRDFQKEVKILTDRIKKHRKKWLDFKDRFEDMKFVEHLNCKIYNAKLELKDYNKRLLFLEETKTIKLWKHQ